MDHDHCYGCQGKGHKSYECPTWRDLLIGTKEKQKNAIEDLEGEANLEFNGNDLVDSEEDSSFISVVHRILTTPKA